MLSSRERVIRAVHHEEPDRVPIFEPYGVFSPTADVVLGRRSIVGNPLARVRMAAQGRVKRLSDGIIRDEYELTKKLKFDMANIVLLPHSNELRPGTKPKMIDEKTWRVGDSIYRLTSQTGYAVEMDSKIMKEGIPAFEEHIRELEEVGNEEIDDVIEDFQYYERRLGRLFKNLDVLICIGSGHTVHQRGWLPLFLKCLYIRPDLIRRYLRQRTRYNIRKVNIAADFGAELVYAHGDIADNHGPMVSQEHYREFFLPEIKKAVESYHKRGLFVFNSSDGNLWPIMEDYLINSGVDGIMEIQKTAGMDLERLKGQFGDRICFEGAVDCSFALPFGSEEEVVRETKETIGILSPGGGHILSSTNSIHPGVKPSNYFTMLETAWKYGRYDRKH